MNILDLVALALGSALVMLVFITQANIENSRVKIKVKIKK
jgi:hypothetical protein